MGNYPKCDKMLEVCDESQSIGNFIEWLGGQGIRLCEDREVEDGKYWDGRTCMASFPITDSIEKILARYFDIDLNKVESERRQILAELQSGG